MLPRLGAILAALLLLPAAAFAKGVEPRPGAMLSGDIRFPRPQAMTLMVNPHVSPKLTASMGFDGRCKGGGLGEIWASNVPADGVVRVRDGRFSATLTARRRGIGGVDGRTAVYRWRLTGRFVDRDTATATVAGSADVRLGGHVVSRCRIAKPASVRLTPGG